MNEPIAISVVLACAEPGKRTLGPCLEALRLDLAGMPAEILVVRSPSARADAGAAVMTPADASGTHAVESSGRLVPELWADGWRASKGRAVAFLIPECIVRPGWARALLAALAAGAAGAGGRFSLHASASATDAAVYFLRYSMFSSPERGTREVEDVAGDNAMYQRVALHRHASTFAEGFWEVDLHRRLRAEGERLVLTGDALAEFGGAPGLLAMAGQRLTHGRHFGAWRARQAARPAWMTVALAPAVPAVLVVRIVRRVWAGGRERRRLLTALPALGVLACAWALGEVVGALAGPPA